MHSTDWFGVGFHLVGTITLTSNVAALFTDKDFLSSISPASSCVIELRKSANRFLQRYALLTPALGYHNSYLGYFKLRPKTVPV